MEKLTERIAWAIETIKLDKDLDRGITDVGLANILGTNKDTLAAYRQQRGLIKGEVIDKLISHYHFSPEWFFKGIGEPFPGARVKYRDVCGPETATLYNNDTAAHLPAGDAHKINIEEAIGKTYKVLSSGTPYAVALYLNVQQFSSAVDATQELHACQYRITNLETQVNDLRNQVNRLSASPTTAEQQDIPLQKEAM